MGGKRWQRSVLVAYADVDGEYPYLLYVVYLWALGEHPSP